MITQLRDVRPAGQSAEVAVKHQQQPVPAVVREKMNSTATVPKFEWDGRFSRQLVHGVHHSFQWQPMHMSAMPDLPSASTFPSGVYFAGQPLSDRPPVGGKGPAAGALSGRACTVEAPAAGAG